MFLSSIKANIEVEPTNMDYLNRSLKAQHFEIKKQKNKDLEAGLNTSSFHIEKNGIFMAVFIMRMDKNLFVCAGYYNGKLVQEKEVKYQTDIPSTIIEIFNSISVRKEDEAFRFDIALDNVRIQSERIEQREKNIERFTQEVKTSQDYQHFKELQKQAYEKIIKDSEYIIENRDEIKMRNNSLIDPLLDIQARKGTLQTAIIAYQEQSQFLLNVKQRLKEHLESLKKRDCDITPGNLNQFTMNEYIQNLTKIKRTELQLKHFVA